MSNSGIDVPDDIVKKYHELKSGKKIVYIIYVISDDKSKIEILKTSESRDWDEFVAELPEKECRWAVYDFEYEAPGGGGTRNKIIFVPWSPDEANIKNKMLFAASKDALKRRLDGVAFEVQATDYSEVAKEAIEERVRRV